MKIEKSEIAAKLSKIKSAVPTKTTLAALHGVLFKNNRLAAYNLEFGIIAELDVESDEEFIIPAKAIEMIDALPDGMIEITTNEANEVLIKTGSIKNKFSSIPASEYPEIPDLESNSDKIFIEFIKLQDAISSVLYAIPVQFSKPVMTGVFFEASDGYLNLVGCDGYRMAWNRIPFSGTFKFIAPKESIQKLISIDIKGDVEVLFDSKKAIFKAPGYTVFTRLLDGTYLDYKTMFMKYENATTINRRAFSDCVRRALICIDTKLKVSIRLNFDGEEMKLSLNSSTSEYSEKIRLNKPVQEPLEIGFNAQYLHDALRSFEGNSVEVGLGSSLKPMTISDADLKALVLPVRLKAEGK
jgi:DNA polymerase-3 subunit beta